MGEAQQEKGRRRRRRYRTQGKADDISTADGEVREADGRVERGTHRRETDGRCRAAGKRACERGHFKTTADRSREEKGEEMCGVRETKGDGLRGYI